MSTSVRRTTKILAFLIIFLLLTINFCYNFIQPNTNSQIGCESGSCSKSTTNDTKSKNITSPYTVVTGANKNHFCELQSWLYYMSETLKGLPEDYKPRIIIYDLGIAKYQKKILSSLEEKGGYFDEVIEFNFDKYPKFWDINENKGEYAWKPGIIKEVSGKYPGIIIWLDSGTFLNRGLYTKLESILTQYDGFLSPRSSGKLLKWTHPGVFEYFKQDIENYKNKNYDNCNGAGVIFDTKKTQYLIDQWYECALVKECIAPEGSSRENHRQDQAILTYLIINDNRTCNLDRSFFGMRIHMDLWCPHIIYYYDKLHGEFFWPSNEDLEEINQLKETYIDHFVYDIWSEGALERLFAYFVENSLDGDSGTSIR